MPGLMDAMGDDRMDELNRGMAEDGKSSTTSSQRTGTEVYDWEAASSEFDYVAARANAVHLLKNSRGNPNYTPDEAEISAIVVCNHETFVKRKLKEHDERKAKPKKEVEENTSGSTVLGAVAVDSGIGRTWVRFGNLALQVIVLKYQDKAERIASFESEFDKVYDTIVKSKAGYNEFHPVLRHNGLSLEVLKSYGICLLETATRVNENREWNDRASSWTLQTMSVFLSIRHASTHGDAQRVVQYCSLRNEFKYDRKRFESPREAVSNHYSALFNLCSSSYTKWLGKIHSGAIERKTANKGNSAEAIKRNREEDKDDNDNSKRGPNSFSRNQKKWQSGATSSRT